MRKSIVFFALLLLIPVIVFSATGNVAGKVVDKNTGKAISNATIQIKGTNFVTFSKSNGSFYLKNVPVGKQVIVAKILGYDTMEKNITVENNVTQNVRFELERKALEIKGLKISETRAVKRETPVAFTNVDEKEIKDKYATEDVPLLLDNVPGLFSSAEGLGDAELSMRGFEADKIQVLINGIPVNDPESQKVYWSNWTGLSSNIKSVQVQRGASSSLYGSGVIGGSINIETMGTEAKQSLTLRTSTGAYFMDKGLTADGHGNFINYDPSNYNVMLKYNSGNLLNGRFNFSAMLEKKYGDSYIIGTKYDGYSFGLETQSVVGDHSINVSFIGAPQHHNQARKTSDPHLFDKLGRNYNRDNHPYQENYYFKPQLSLRDEWDLSENGLLVTNAFVTKGSGGGKYLYNSTFNVDTGEVGFQDIKKESYQNDDFGKHAYFMWQNYGIKLDGFQSPDDLGGNFAKYTAPNGTERIIMAGNSMFSAPAAYTYSFRANSRNEHVQFGINSYWQQKFSDMFTLVSGYEFRKWHARHYSLRELFRINSYNVDDSLVTDLNQPDNVTTYDDTQRRYDYTSDVNNLSGFVRAKIKLLDRINIMADGQYAIYSSKVDENPIESFDYAYGKFTGKSFYLTKDLPLLDDNDAIVTDSLGNPIKKYSEDDYKKTFKFFSPKFGINWNVNDNLNILFNTSIAHKEPRVTEWYNRYKGPDASQVYEETFHDTLNDGTVHTYSVKDLRELIPETSKTIEFGLGYTTSLFDLNVNAYYTKYVDKIAGTVDSLENKVTLNLGDADYKGLEVSSNIKYFNWDGNLALTISKNTWTKIKYDKIFNKYTDAKDVIGKHVPYAPERMANAGIGYTIENVGKGKLRLGLDAKWWDNYWVSYTNEYEDYYADAEAADSIEVDEYGHYYYYDEAGNEIHIIKDARLPYFLNFATSLKYDVKLNDTSYSFKIKFDNIFNKEDNYTAGYYRADYNRYKYVNGVKQADILRGKPYMYVTPYPSFNVFFTAEVKFF